MKRIAYITTILCMLLACGPRKEYKETLLKAEELMDDHPDSALHMLEQLRDTMQHADKADRMYYELLLADAQNKSYVDFTTDSIMKEVVHYYDRHGSANERMRAHYLLGCTYRDMGEAPMALQCYQEAVGCADTTRNDCLSLLYRIHGQMSDLYYNEYLPKEAMAEMIKAERLAWTAGDTLSALIFYERRANVYDMIEWPDSAIIIRKKGIKRFLDYRYDHEAFIAEGGLILSLVKAKRYNELPAYLKEYEMMSGLFDNSGNIRKGYELYYYAKGMYYMNVSSPDSSKILFRKLLQESRNVNDSLAACEGLRVLYIKEGVSDSVAEYANRCISLINKSYDKSTARNMQQISALYNYSRLEKEAAHERENTRKAKEILRTLILLAVVLIGAISWFYYRRQQKKKEMILNLENDLGNAILIREEIQEELKRLKEKDYESVIATKEKKEAELTQTIERLRAKNELYKRKSNENNTDRLDDFLNSSISQLFIKKANSKTERPVPSDAEWRLLMSQFSKDMPAIYNSFGHNKALSSLEQYVCILLLLKIPTNAIIMMVKSSPQTVSKAKSRANMKLFNEKSANTLENNLFGSLKRS